MQYLIILTMAIVFYYINNFLFYAINWRYKAIILI